MTVNENPLTRQIEDYITYKRSLGYEIAAEAGELRRFAAFAGAVGHTGPLTSGLAMRWASLNDGYSRFYMARRLETVRTFARYISAFDSDAQIPQTGVFGKCHHRTKARIYTDEETSLLIAGAGKLFSPDGIRRYTVSTAIGLLRSTGLRVSELTLLRITDVRLPEGYLFINSSKFKKQKVVPLHHTATEKLTGYRDFITRKLGQRDETAYFFVGSYGRRFNTRAFEYAFSLIRPVLSANTAFEGRRNCRLYDIRHTFACETVKRWLESGIDVNQKLYLLSTYMGHVKPEDTYWYLSATPGLLDISCKRYETMFAPGHPSKGEPPAPNQRPGETGKGAPE
jgi:site-specific recombinase XerD